MKREGKTLKREECEGNRNNEEERISVRDGFFRLNGESAISFGRRKRLLVFLVSNSCYMNPHSHPLNSPLLAPHQGNSPAIKHSFGSKHMNP